MPPLADGRKGHGLPSADGMGGERDPAEMVSMFRDPKADVMGPGMPCCVSPLTPEVGQHVGQRPGAERWNGQHPGTPQSVQGKVSGPGQP